MALSSSETNPIVIVCPECRATLPEDFVMLKQRRAICSSCGVRFAIDSQLASPRRVWQGRRSRMAPPPGMSSETGPAGRTLTWIWPRYRAVGPLIFLVIFSGFLTFWTLVRVTIGIPEMNILLVTLAAAVLFLLWVFLAYRLNSTRIEISHGWLRVRHGPIPWPGRRDLPMDTITQLYSQMYHERATRRVNSHTTYHLRAILVNGAKLLLVHNMTSKKQALFFEQEIERYMGLQDQPVRAELPR